MEYNSIHELNDVELDAVTGGAAAADDLAACYGLSCAGPGPLTMKQFYEHVTDVAAGKTPWLL